MISATFRNGSTTTTKILQLLQARVAKNSSILSGPSSCYCRCLTTSQTSPSPEASSKLVKPNEDFWDKNKRLDRPMSPHLSIYAWQLTNVLSITHRGTGVALSGLTSMFAIGMICASSPYPVLLNSLATCGAVGPALIFSAKFLLAWPLFFHTLNGIRHLAWDAGKGFELKDLYMSGYAVVGVSTVLSLLAAAM